MRFPILFFCVVISFSVVNGQQAAIVMGQITDVNGKVLPGIHVYAQGTDLGAVSDLEGIYRISGLPAGSLELRVSGVGFEKISREFTVVGGQQSIRLDFVMQPATVLLDQAFVEAASITGGSDRVRDIPGSAHHIDARELKKFSHNDINRVLRNIPGINIQDEEGFGLRPNIGFRGTGVERSSKITLMEDGVLISPAPYVAPAAYYFPTTGRMQGIEVRKGSSQIKFGPNTTGGALNLLSTTIPESLGAGLNLSGGSFGTQTMHLHIGDSGEKLGFLVETYQMRSNGFKDLDGLAKGNTGFRTEDYLIKARWSNHASAKVPQSVLVKGGRYFENSRETYLGLTDTDFGETPNRRYAASQKDVMNTDQKQLTISHTVQPSDILRITTTIYRTEFNRNWYKIDKVDADGDLEYIGISEILDNPTANASDYVTLKGETSLNPNSLSVKANNRGYFARGFQTSAKSSFESGLVDHSVELGLRIHQDQIDRFQWVDFYRMTDGKMYISSRGTPGTESNRIEMAAATSLYVEYTLKSPFGTLVPGLRYEYISTSREDFGKNDPDRDGTNLARRNNDVSVWIPGVGLQLDLNRHWKLLAGVHKGFSPAGSKEGTDPEESINLESGFRWERGSAYASTILFYNDYKNLLGVDLSASGGQGTGDLFNGGTAIAQGIEFESGFTTRLSKDLFMPIRLSYTFTDAYFTNSFDSEFEAWDSVSDGDKLPYLSPHQVAINVGFEQSRFSFYLNSKFNDAMRTEAGHGRIPDQRKVEKHVVTDIVFNLNITSGVRISAGVDNVTNETYIVSRRPAGVRPGLPRSMRFSIKATL